MVGTEVKENQPSLIVIDLLTYFLVLKSANDYNEVIQGVNQLLDTLTKIKYKGALVVTQHARKAEGSVRFVRRWIGQHCRASVLRHEHDVQTSP